jgi:hypothetical protein
MFLGGKCHITTIQGIFLFYMSPEIIPPVSSETTARKPKAAVQKVTGKPTLLDQFVGAGKDTSTIGGEDQNIVINEDGTMYTPDTQDQPV